MSQERWSEVDAYLAELLVGADAALDEAVRTSAQAGLPPIAVSACQGKLLQLLARMQGAERILEIGTLGGYSTIWLARALPAGGRLVTLELDPGYAEVAATNVARAGLADVVDVRVGPAAETLEAMLAEAGDPFDMVFIDADKKSTPEYFRAALAMTRPGGVIVIDNVVRGGALIDADSGDPGVQGMRRFHELLAAQANVSATTIQTVGSKGYDGFTLARVDR